jgi:hypothetical protein
MRADQVRDLLEERKRRLRLVDPAADDHHVPGVVGRGRSVGDATTVDPAASSCTTGAAAVSVPGARDRANSASGAARGASPSGPGTAWTS